MSTEKYMANLDKKKIKDNPTFGELLQTVKGMKYLSKMVSLFEKFGIKNAELSEAFEQVPDFFQKCTLFNWQKRDPCFK